MIGRSLAQLVRSLRMSRRQLSLPPRELEVLLLERLRRRAAKRLPPLRFASSEQLAQLASDPTGLPARSRGRSSCG